MVVVLVGRRRVASYRESRVFVLLFGGCCGERVDVRRCLMWSVCVRVRVKVERTVWVGRRERKGSMGLN
jgi:hypothetical protein